MKKELSFLPHLLNITVLIIITCSLIACGASKNQPTKTKHSFRLAILDSDQISWSKRASRYHTWETLWPPLKQAYPSAVIHSITDVDIESYDWGQQVITLTPEASNILIEVFDCSIEDGKLSYPLCLSLTDRFFVVALDDMLLYGGDFTEVGSVIGLPYPVIYPGFYQNDDRLFFTLMDAHSATQPASPHAWATPGWDVMRDQRIKTLFSDLGKLIE